MIYSKAAHATGVSSGFFFGDDKNAPSDSISVSDADLQAAVKLPAGSSYDFDMAGKLTVTFAPPAPIVASPISITAYQIRLALNKAGLRADVEAAVAAGSQDLKDAWGYAQVFTRDDTLVVQMGAAIGQTPAQIDALFALAKTMTI